MIFIYQHDKIQDVHWWYRVVVMASKVGEIVVHQLTSSSRQLLCFCLAIRCTIEHRGVIRYIIVVQSHINLVTI